MLSCDEAYETIGAERLKIICKYKPKGKSDQKYIEEMDFKNYEEEKMEEIRRSVADDYQLALTYLLVVIFAIIMLICGTTLWACYKIRIERFQQELRPDSQNRPRAV